MKSQSDVQIPSFLRRFWPILFLAIVPMIPLFRAVFMGEAIGPFDQIRQMAPWNGPRPSQPWDVLQADGVLQFYVWRDLVFESWGNGQVPFWNSYQLAGMPLLGNSQSGALYPPHIVMGILHVSTAAAITFLAWLHLFWAGFGAYFLCRRLGGNRIGACLAGSSFSLSTFMLAWTGLPSVIETVSWIPWVLGCLLLTFRGLRSARLGSFLGVSVSSAMMVLAGHLQFAAYGFIAATLLVLWCGLSRHDFVAELGPAEPTNEDIKAGTLRGSWRPSYLRIVTGFLALLFGVILAAPQLIPVLQYSHFSHRRNSPTETGYRDYVGNAIQSYELSKVIAPTIQGNPREMVSDKLPVSTYYPALLKPGANFAESAFGPGLVVILLLCVLCVVIKPREANVGILLIGAVGILLAFGTPLNRLLYYCVPGWSSTGSPGRAACLFVLAACVGAGSAASRIGELDARRIKIAGGLFTCLAVVCALIQGNYKVPPTVGADIIDTLSSQALVSSFPTAVGIACIFGLAFWLYKKESSLRSKALVLSLPVLSCVAFFGTAIIPTGTPDLKVNQNLGTRRIASINNAWDIYTARHATLPPNLAALNRIHSLDGYDSLLHRDTVALLRDIDGKDPAPDANGNIMFIKPSADLHKLAEAGVTEVWSQKPIATLGLPKQEDGLFKYGLPGPGRASTPQGPSEIVSESRSGLRIRATGPGKLVVRERNMPGWLAKIDGSRATLTGSTWMEVDLPTGEHDVELNYVAPGFMSGIYMALPAWIVVILLAFSERVRTRRSNKTS